MQNEINNSVKSYAWILTVHTALTVLLAKVVCGDTATILVARLSRVVARCEVVQVRRTVFYNNHQKKRITIIEPFLDLE